MRRLEDSDDEGSITMDDSPPQSISPPQRPSSRGTASSKSMSMSPHDCMSVIESGMEQMTEKYTKQERESHTLKLCLSHLMVSLSLCVCVCVCVSMFVCFLVCECECECE